MHGDGRIATNLQQRKRVVIVAMSGNTLINFSGPSDVFTYADKFLSSRGSKMGYDVLIVSPTTDKKIISSTGIEINCAYCAMEIKMPVDTLIIAGNDFQNLKKPEYNDFFNWLSSINENNARRIGSVCGGAFALARAGILNGKKATTHWDLSEKL